MDDEWSPPEVSGWDPTDPESLYRRRRRNLTITNEFLAPVVIHRVEVPEELEEFLEVTRAGEEEDEEDLYGVDSFEEVRNSY